MVRVLRPTDSGVASVHRGLLQYLKQQRGLVGAQARLDAHHARCRRGVRHVALAVVRARGSAGGVGAEHADLAAHRLELAGGAVLRVAQQHRFGGGGGHASDGTSLGIRDLPGGQCF